jgi:hypothetical protein
MQAASVLGKLHGHRLQDGADRVLFQYGWFMVMTVSDPTERVIASTSSGDKTLTCGRRASMSERRRASIVQQQP